MLPACVSLATNSISADFSVDARFVRLLSRWAYGDTNVGL